MVNMPLEPKPVQQTKFQKNLEKLKTGLRHARDWAAISVLATGLAAGVFLTSCATLKERVVIARADVKENQIKLVGPLLFRVDHVFYIPPEEDHVYVGPNGLSRNLESSVTLYRARDFVKAKLSILRSDSITVVRSFELCESICEAEVQNNTKGLTAYIKLPKINSGYDGYKDGNRSVEIEIQMTKLDAVLGSK